jgi:histidinol-phosphatase (PHP family)
MSEFAKVSVHGGHSGSYCGHATDSLDQVVARYAQLGFEWVCLTEHMPTENPALIAPEEATQDYDVARLQVRFEAYFSQARHLAEQYRGRMDILVGFETETYSGYEAEIAALIARFQPDMLVGSVHHLYDILFDGSVSHYQQALAKAGNITQLYCDYFDTQLALINRFEPAVIGHFDLIRIHDPDYLQRWEIPAIQDRALRNLERIKQLDLILDLNMRALAKGASEPYISRPWLEYAIGNDIAVVPGDDSHGIADVSRKLEEGVNHFRALGGNSAWRKPARGRHRKD